MQKRIGILAVMAAVLPALAACAGSMGHMPPVGGLYAGAKGVAPNTQAQVSDGTRPGPKTGEACALGVLGLASWGDMSLAKAKEVGGINFVSTMDYKTMDILGVVFQKHCTIITGSEGDPGGGDMAVAVPVVPQVAPAPATPATPAVDPNAPPPPPGG